jgi:hypothetical protein
MYAFFIRISFYKIPSPLKERVRERMYKNPPILAFSQREKEQHNKYMRNGF